MSIEKNLGRLGFAGPPALRQTAERNRGTPFVSFYYLLIALAALIAVAALAWHWRAQRRQRALAHLLDGADAMERLLHRTRERMQAMQGVVARVPKEVGAVAQASLESDRQVQEGLRDVLQHRLWIQRHAQTASQRDLDAACEAMDRAQERIATELGRLERAGAELAEATDAAIEAARREPPQLRRG